MISHTPIFITGIQRSGAAIIARIIASCNVFSGNTNANLENIRLNVLVKQFYVTLQSDPLGQYPLPDFTEFEDFENWDSSVFSLLKDDGYKVDKSWMYKSAKIFQTLPLWYSNFPNAKYVIVRRKPCDVVESCMKTGYMTAFKSEKLRNKLNLKTEEEGWLWWIHQQDEMLRTYLKAFTIDYRVIWPERMVQGDYSQIYEMLNWLELEWNDDIVCMTKKLLWKSKYKGGLLDECSN